MIRTWLNYNPEDAYEESDSTSMAVPDQTYTVRQLFDRMARGLSLDDSGLVHPVYYEDDDIDNPDPTQNPAFDLADYSEQMASLQETIASRANSSIKSKRSGDKKEDKPSKSKGEEEAKSEESSN